MSIVRIALILLVVVAGLAFHVRNDQLVVVDFYLGNYEIPLSLALAIALLGGAVLGVLSGLPSWLKLKRAKAKLGRQLKAHQPDSQASEEQSAD
ncbi:MAG: LapA family protein [Gammaproteobacteria bacterium]|nr:LapA family protein [Gammaproteobacteria bacterium]